MMVGTWLACLIPSQPGIEPCLPIGGVLQVPPSHRPDFEKFLVELGYNYVNETNNPAFKDFLA